MNMVIELECTKCGYKFETVGTCWRGQMLFGCRCPRCGVMHTDEDCEDVQRLIPIKLAQPEQGKLPL